jgi:hypothetical protein
MASHTIPSLYTCLLPPLLKNFVPMTSSPDTSKTKLPSPPRSLYLSLSTSMQLHQHDSLLPMTSPSSSAAPASSSLADNSQNLPPLWSVVGPHVWQEVAITWKIEQLRNARKQLKEKRREFIALHQPATCLRSTKDPTQATTIMTNTITPQGPLLELKKLHSQFHRQSKSRSSMSWNMLRHQVSQRLSGDAHRGGPSLMSSATMKEPLRPGRLRWKTATASPSSPTGGSVKHFLSRCFDNQLSCPEPSPLSLQVTSSTLEGTTSPSTS